MVYADLRKWNQTRLGRGAEGSQACHPGEEAPRGPADGGRNGPALAAGGPGRDPAVSPTSWGLLQPPSSEALGPSAATWSQGSPKLRHRAQPCLQGRCADTYELVQAAAAEAARDAACQEDGAYEQIPVRWGGPARPCHPGASLTCSELSGLPDCDYEGTPETLEPRNAYEQIPAAKSRDAGRARKVGSRPVPAGPEGTTGPRRDMWPWSPPLPQGAQNIPALTAAWGRQERLW